MNIRSTHLIIGLFALGLISQGENVRSNLEKSGNRRQEQSSFNDRLRRNRTEAKQALKLSQVALDRYKANCILVIDNESGKENFFLDGTTVLDSQLSRPLRSGALVCNRLGDTARVSALGTITDIARIATPDQAAFKKLISEK